MSLRDQALAVWTEQQQTEAEYRRQLAQREAQLALDALINDLVIHLHIPREQIRTLSVEPARVAVEDFEFIHNTSDHRTHRSLIAIYDCSACGMSDTSFQIDNLADLGCFLARHSEEQHAGVSA